MKKLLIILTLGLVTGLAFIIPSQQSSEGVSFDKFTLEEAIQEAKKSDKSVFIDVSTSWCGYCKKMKSKTYTDDKVADALNTKYVNISIDAEKGEGPAIAKKYGVRAYPTQIILDAEGKLLSKNVGYLKPNELLNFLK